MIKCFLNAIELEIKDICVEEITLNATRSMLQCANRNDYIDDDDEYEAVADAFDEYLDSEEFDELVEEDD